MNAPSSRPSPLLLRDGSPAIDAWPLDRRVLHLNHGSFGAVPHVAIKAQSAHRRRMEANPVGWMPTQAEQVGATRADLADRLGVPAAYLAMVPNASAGASAVFNAQILRPGDEIVVTDHGYGAVNRGAARLARRFAAVLKIAQIPLNSTADEAVIAILDAVTERTRLVVIDQITSATALRLPVEEITRRTGDARVLVDGAHSPGLIDKPLDALAADYWIGNFHKFGCAPRGTAVLVARPNAAQELNPLIDSWNADLPFPQRFDMQGTLDHTAYLAAPTAWDFLEETWGWDRLRAHMAAMVRWGAEIIAEAFSVHTGEDHRVEIPLACDAMRLVRLPAPLAQLDTDCGVLRERLFAECGAECAVTSFNGIGYLRLSAHAYTTADDFDVFAQRVVPVLVNWAKEG